MIFAEIIVNLLSYESSVMNHHIDISKDIERLLSDGRVNEALDLIDNSAATLGAIAEIRSATARLRESYGLMTHYALKLMPDPSRAELYAGILDSVRSLADELHRRSRVEDAPTLYFNTLRYQQTSRDITIAALLGEYHRVNRRLQMAMLTEDVERAGREFTRRGEDLEKRIFNLIWTTHPLTVDDAAAIGNIFSDPSLPVHFKALCISALMMGQLEYYDERRLRLLMDAYGSDDASLSVRSLCSLLIVMSVQRGRPFSPSLMRRFDAMCENPRWPSDVRMAMLQFIRTRDTERIGKKLTDEVIPEMMKLRPEIEKLGETPLDPESFEENPEWAELLDKSGIADKLKELQELQEDGGDVMMATFSNLKTFPFFNDMPNWFMPFHSSHSVIAESDDASVRMLGDVVGAAPMLCNSDKYSIMLSLSHVPAAQREMMASQLKAHSAQMAGMSFGELATSAKDREAIARAYVQDLYRFFRLFRRKGEFSDPFATTLNLVTHPRLAEVFDDADSLQLVGEFYFKHQHFGDAFDIFRMLSEKMPPSSELFQKMGYCRQMSDDLGEAIRYYEQSELLNSESVWTIRKLAVCHRQMKNWKDALAYYRRLERHSPEDAGVAYNIGLCEMKLGHFDRAIPCFYKVEFIRGESDRSSRPLFECHLMQRNLEKARKYCDLVMGRSPLANDYLFAGMLDIKENSLAAAVSRFAMSIACRNFDIDGFIRDFNDNLADFQKGEDAIAIDDLTVKLIIDSAISESANLGHKI